MKFFTTQMFLEKVLGDVINECIICCEMAADLTGSCKKSEFTPITIYVTHIHTELPDDVEQFIVSNFDECEWTYFNDSSIRVTTLNQTIIDLFRLDRDLTVTLECLGNYYIKHNDSFDGLYIPDYVKLEFEKWKYYGMHCFDND